jgi:hypothetical protein
MKTMMNNHKGSEVMISILLLEILDYVAFILSATLYHGNPATKQKLWNIELTERYTSYAAGMYESDRSLVLCVCFVDRCLYLSPLLFVIVFCLSLD